MVLLSSKHYFDRRRSMCYAVNKEMRLSPPILVRPQDPAEFNRKHQISHQQNEIIPTFTKHERIVDFFRVVYNRDSSSLCIFAISIIGVCWSVWNWKSAICIIPFIVSLGGLWNSIKRINSVFKEGQPQPYNLRL